MQRARTERIRRSVSWALCLAVMALIFYFSARTADESVAQSSSVLLFLEKIFGRTLTSFAVRKGAHFAEYAALGFLLANALFQSGKKRWGVWAAGLASLYAATDEVHQLFVPGRACQLTDWLLDTAGGAAGAALFLALLLLLRAAKKHRARRLTGRSDCFKIF